MKFSESLRNNKFNTRLFGEVPTLKLGDFFRLQGLKRTFIEAIITKNRKLTRSTLQDILGLCVDTDIGELPFVDAFQTMYQIIANTGLSANVVFMKPPPEDGAEQKREPERWSHEEHSFVQWVDTLAKAYGWSLKDILGLDINTAAYLYQEILVQEQFDKEWQYSLTEMAYPYDKNSKTSRYKPLERPYWMRKDIDGVIKKTKLRRDMLPMGVVVDLSGMGVLSYEAVPEETEESDK